MKIVIAGGTGFLGRPLAASLAADRHAVVVLSRHPVRHGAGGAPGAQVRTVPWTPNGEAGDWASEADGADVVVNLAGEPIARTRWTAAQKARILESRIHATRSLVAAIGRAAAPPGVLVSGSAVGYYGPCGEAILDEGAPAGTDFLAEVCVRWEAEAGRASTSRTRVVAIRTGLVLERDGGALARMLLPFNIGAGGRVGSGRQYWPWIHRDDWIALVRWAIEAKTITGAVNATAPRPVTNAEFTRALGQALRRPALLPAPPFALRLVLGEMADALLLSGQRAIPAKAERAGFVFRYPRLDEALRAIFAVPPE
jgi:uncharacterized protein (TIGR01777 family)